MLTSNSQWLTFLYRRPTVIVGALLAVAALAFSIAHLPPWSEQRALNSSVRFPLSAPSSTGWTTENAYPGLRFFEPTCIAYAQDGSRRVFVLERRGTVVMFTDDPEVSATERVLDISSQVWRTENEDDGAVAIALHPEFGVAGSPNENFFYLLYTAKVGERRYDRLSRFTLKDGIAGQHVVLIEQEDENIWHNGGALTFGPDGFLYVGMGDEGTNGDGLENGQRIDRDLFCGILRIDVDRQGGDVSHPPPRRPDTGSTTGYFIPKDNPFVGVPNVLEEFWAHGLRNPYRAAFDPETGELWVADVGHLRREEINLVEKGGNYGWSYLEGSLPFEDSYLRGRRPQRFHGTERPPLWEYPHLNGDNCIIGGFVYRGDKHDDLQGKFIYADNGSGRVWALARASEGAVTNVELLALPVSSKTGISSLQPDADGEPLLIILGECGTSSGTIRRLVQAPQHSSAAIPLLLSQTGLFSDVETLTPSPGVIPYEVNTPQSAGDASIRRWLMLPGDGSDPDPQIDRIGRSDRANWQFPTGTVFVQHFDLPLRGRSWRPIETRVLVRHQQGGVYGVTYRWNEEGTDAELAETANKDTWTAGGDSPAAQTDLWHFLDRQSCLACHNQNAGYVLGVNARQFHRRIKRRSLLGSSHQLLAWSQAGMFGEPFSATEVSSLPRLVAPDDVRAHLDLRARSFLDVNCASCHRPGGARANFFADFDNTESPHALQVKPKQGDFGIAGARIVSAGDPFRSVLYYRMAKLGQGRMPFVGSQRLDSNGLLLVRRWIEQMQLASDEAVSPEVIEKRRQQNQLLDRLTADEMSEDEATDAVKGLLADASGAFQLWQHVHDGQGTKQLRDAVVALATRSEYAPARDLFEWYVPPEKRTQRLGTQFDLNEVLRLRGDAERGRHIYETHDSLMCRSCHHSRPGGRPIGPSLYKVAQRMNRSELLYHIVHPSERIDPEYATWLAATVEGQVVSGLLVERSDDWVTLIDANGKEYRIPESSLDYLEPSSQSMMPTHLLQFLTAAEAADLLEYLQHTDGPQT